MNPRELAKWVLPPGVKGLLKGAWLARQQPLLPANRVLVNRHASDKRCVVIGNGPSLKDMDLRPLAAMVTIGANAFYRHPHALDVGLRYQCINDIRFLVDEPRAVAWHAEVSAGSPRSTVILPWATRDLVRRRNLYQGHTIYFIAGGEPVHDAASINLDPTRPFNVGMTTGTTLCIPLALAMGFKEVCLVGFDANWLADIHASYHFYAQSQHFPEFDSVAKDVKANQYETELASALREFESHRLLNERAAQMGARICNATRGGLLDMYPRVVFEDWLQGGSVPAG
jgi:hypothetical protein